MRRPCIDKAFNLLNHFCWIVVGLRDLELQSTVFCGQRQSASDALHEFALVVLRESEHAPKP
jgi:hypothetical protein